MPDVPPETACEHCITIPAKLRSGFTSKNSFASHRSSCKKNNHGKKKQTIRPSAPAAKQPASAAVKLDSKSKAKRKRTTGTVSLSMPLKLGTTVNVFYGMRPDGSAASTYTSAVIVEVARVEHFDQSGKHAALLIEDANDRTTSKAATCEFVYKVDYKDDALHLQLPGTGKINPLCEPV